MNENVLIRIIIIKQTQASFCPVKIKTKWAFTLKGSKNVFADSTSAYIQSTFVDVWIKKTESVSIKTILKNIEILWELKFKDFVIDRYIIILKMYK